MNRRTLLRSGCALCATLAGGATLAQSPWSPPARFVKPDVSTDEGGLWAMMDREETRLRRSPFTIRDPRLVGYVQDIACRLGGEHCGDIRVHVVRTPLFNASMAPNGMMQVWSGLLLRMENEAQLAAVIGHEIGHYLERHSVERLRDIRSRTAFGQFLGLFGLVGAVGQLALLAGAFSFSRDNERDADRIGAVLMRNAGYDTAEAPKVWRNLMLEIKARPDGDPERNSPMFATHPAPDERQQTLAQLAESMPGGSTQQASNIERIAAHRLDWVTEEVQRGQREESIALFSRIVGQPGAHPDYYYGRGGSYRLRGKNDDLDLALADFHAAIAQGRTRAVPPLHRHGASRPGAMDAGQESFQRYLGAAPDAPDAPMIRSYVEEMGT